jgi:Putative Flp pilus-assembly TadE/G-like
MLRDHEFHRIRARRGSALAVTGVSLVAIMGVMAVVLDGGLLMSERRHAQSVADASAMAAAYSLYNNYTQNQGLDPSGTAAKEARSIASDNGYVNDGVTSTVTVNIPPLTGSHIGKSGYVEVNLQYNQARCFSALWGAGTMAVTGRSVARGIYSPASAAILLLDPSMPKALNATGNGNVTVTGGGSIVVDSSNSQGGNITGSGNVSASNINFYGSYNTTSSGRFLGTIKTNVAPTADPLSALPVPNPSTMTTQSSSNYQISSSGTYTLQPGVYTGGISISAPSGTVTLASGIFYMAGGGFSINGGINVTGSGVMIYNAPVQNSDQVKLTGNGTLTLSAPTSGTYKGITIFETRTSTATVDITGNGGMNLTGTIYSAGANVDLTGNGSSNVIGSQIIADSMTVTGNGSVNVSYTASGLPVRDTRIVE